MQRLRGCSGADRHPRGKTRRHSAQRFEWSETATPPARTFPRPGFVRLVGWASAPYRVFARCSSCESAFASVNQYDRPTMARRIMPIELADLVGHDLGNALSGYGCLLQ